TALFLARQLKCDETIDSRAQPFSEPLIYQLMVGTPGFPSLETESTREIAEQRHAAHFEVAAGEVTHRVFACHPHLQFAGESYLGQRPYISEFRDVQDFLRDHLHPPLEFVDGLGEVGLILKSAFAAEIGGCHLPFLAKHFENL